MSSKIPGHFREKSVIFPRNVRDISGTHPGNCWEIEGNVHGISRKFPGFSFGNYLGNVHAIFAGEFPGIFREISGFCSGSFQEISGNFTGYVREISGKFLGNSGKLPGHFREMSGKFPRISLENSGKFPGNFQDIS